MNSILLAPNAMKGALSASKIASILEKTLRRKFPPASIVSFPVADGGNGTLDCLMNALGGTIHEKEVTGPVSSMKVRARFGVTRNNIAIIESAEAAGLHLLSPTPETIAQSTSRGVGELIVEAMNRQCKEIWIGLGGTATNDGGAGIAKALGVRLLDENGKEIKDGAINVMKLSKIDLQFSNANLKLQIDSCKLKILSDVQNPLLGNNGATYTFARQKGASEEQLPYLEAALKNFADVVEAHVGKQFRDIPGSGAAGGLGFGLLALCDAETVSGIDFILDAITFDEKLRQCDCVITSEGQLDEQTLWGKGIAGISQRAQQFHKPVHAFVGTVNGNIDQLKTKLSLASLTQISPPEMETREAIKNAAWLLADAVYHHNF